MENTLSVIPLGGVEEIGLNMTVLEYGEDILVVDAGLMFPEEEMLGVDLVIPDVAYVQERIKKLGFSLLEMKQYLEGQGMKADGFKLTLDRIAEIVVTEFDVPWVRVRLNKQGAIRGSRDVAVEGIVILNDTGWTVAPRCSEDLRFENIKLIAWGNNSDGIDICASRRVRVSGSFLRNNDDCIVIKATGEAAGDVEGVEVTGATLWNSLGGNALEIGFELRTASVRDIVFRNSDIIRVENGAAFSIHNGDWAEVRDVLFEDIRVEHARSELVDLYIGLSIYSADCPWEYARGNPGRKPLPAGLRAEKSGDHSGQWLALTGGADAEGRKNRGRIANVTFRDIQVLAEWPLISRVVGFDQEHAARGVVFEGLRAGGREILSAEEGGFVVRHAPGLMFKKGR